MAPSFKKLQQKMRARRKAKKSAQPESATTPPQQMVSLDRTTVPDDPQDDADEGTIPQPPPASQPRREANVQEEHWQLLQSWFIPSAIGNERLAMSYITDALKTFHLPERRIQQLQTAVAEATMNAMEHGNGYNPDVPVTLQLLSSAEALAVRIIDQGDSQAAQVTEVPDIEAKLAELQSPRGWGLFLIQNMVDDMRIFSTAQSHTIELILRLEGEPRAS